MVFDVLFLSADIAVRYIYINWVKNKCLYPIIFISLIINEPTWLLRAVTSLVRCIFSSERTAGLLIFTKRVWFLMNFSCV